MATPYQEPYTTELRIVGLPDAGDFQLVLNGAPPVTLSAAALAALRITVHKESIAPAARDGKVP